MITCDHHYLRLCFSDIQVWLFNVLDAIYALALIVAMSRLTSIKYGSIYPYESMTVKELRERAKKREVKVSARMNKAELIAALRAVR